MSTFFLFSLPGGGEWLIIVFALFFLLIAPVLAVVFYMEAKRLRRENKVLLEKLMERK